MHFQIVLAFFTYFSILLLIAGIAYRKISSDKDYIVGSRSLNFWLTALSAHASDMSAWLFMALPAALLVGGPSKAWIAIGLIIGMFLNWQFVAVKLRTKTEASNSYTLSTFFERRFNDRSGTIRILTAVMSLFYLTYYLSASLIGIGLLLESVFEINYFFGLSIATCVMLIYTMIGGFVTIAWMDLFQGLFLLGVVCVVPFYALMELPTGWKTIYDTALDRGISMSLFPEMSVLAILNIIVLSLEMGLGYFGQPHIITKFMGIRSPGDLKKAKYLGMSWQVLTLTCSVFVGLVGIGFFRNSIITNPELVFIEMVKQLFFPYLAGFILCGLLAATISTMDSQMLVCGSVLSEDLYKRLVKKPPSEKELVWITRIGILIVAVIALSIAFYKSSTVQKTVLFAWTGLGCSFGPLVLTSLYSKTATKQGAIAGIIVGGVIAGLWQFIHPCCTDLEIPAMIPGFIGSFLAISLVSAITRVKRT